MAKTKLDSEEQKLLETDENGEFKSEVDADRWEYLKYVSGGLKAITANKPNEGLS